MNKSKKRNSLIYQLVLAFLISSIIPVTLIMLIFNFRMKNYIEGNMNQLIKNNVYKTQQYLQLSLNVYENLMYDVCSNDDIIQIVEAMNEQKGDMDVLYSQLRRELNRTVNNNTCVQGITIITSSGRILYYDKLSSSSENSHWIKFNKNFDNSMKNTDDIQYLPTQFETKIGDEKYYMFHMAHKIVDYRDIYRNIGVVIISIDSSVLEQVCTQQYQEGSQGDNLGINMICDEEGKIVYYKDKSKIGKNEKDELTSKYKVTAIKDNKSGWVIKNLYDEKQYMKGIRQEEETTIILMICIVFILVLLVFKFTDKLTSSIRKVVNAMKTVENGQLKVKIDQDKNMPTEICTIADGFNSMVERVEELMKNVTEATLRQKNAEIKALEAQINPHFLYNTLDTINWKAIENEEFEISNMINSLAKILRYAVLNSNGVVTVKDELEWLKSYIYLQESRLENKFEFFVNISEELQCFETHKLLLQPFIENSIRHGFFEKNKTYILIITCREQEASIEFCIEDNGVGIDKETLYKINNNLLKEQYSKDHIGIGNVMARLEMYYGKAAGIHVESEKNKYTKVYIRIPKNIAQK
ncbi:sensor histidine kinase [Clostridium hydrogenum]|uniref:sensor histidine kinase n=1 Tax=Clostridium hydrogenum TaxID=2855764 RepID=UPI001F441326|nr:sensor histidine kinase [Clostridium hydrogenum]